MRCGVIFIAAIALAGVSPLRFGPHGAFTVEQSADGFGTRSHGVVEVATGKQYPLPQSDYAAYVRLRPDDLQFTSIRAATYQRQEVIGPHHVVGTRLWFGKDFYDGEGDKGVGAFGYFDAATRQYTLFSPPEVAGFAASAILPEPSCVWVGLYRFGEDISGSPGGLVRWDIQTHQVDRIPLEFIVNRISRDGNALRLETTGGYAELRGHAVKRFALTASGGAVEISRFPPLPSHY